MTSHNPDHAFMIADQVSVMFDQGLLGTDAPHEIITEQTLFDIYGIKVELKSDDVFGKICAPQLVAKPLENLFEPSE